MACSMTSGSQEEFKVNIKAWQDKAIKWQGNYLIAS